jgi:hypothetical protein
MREYLDQMWEAALAAFAMAVRSHGQPFVTDEGNRILGLLVPT